VRCLNKASRSHGNSMKLLALYIPWHTSNELQGNSVLTRGSSQPVAAMTPEMLLGTYSG
jgi:hypothetical protein